jgi:undecaprenyl-diphosphatase
LFQAALLLALLAFGVLTFFASQTAYFPFDLTITLTVQTIPGGLFAALMALVSWFGYAPQAIILTALIILILAWLGQRWEAQTAALAAIGVGVLNTMVKLLIHRPRPEADLVHTARLLESYSFPSAHVMFYTVFFGFLFFLGFTRLRPSLLRSLLLTILGGLVALVGLSRIYRGEHWFSDVLAAYLLGGLALYAVIRVYLRFNGLGSASHSPNH